MKNIGILGLGNIARKMAMTVNEMKGVQLYAVASRSEEKSLEFQKEYNAVKSYSSYKMLLEDDSIDLVYIAVPHSHHYKLMKMCLKYNKNILCEKAFTVNYEQAKEILDEAKQKNIFVAEAIWTRYLPSRKIIDDIIESGEIGKVSLVSANLGYKVDHKERIVKKELAGGALLDLTVYPINFSCMVLKDKIRKIDTTMIEYPETKVDAIESVNLTFEDGSFANIYSTIYSRTDRKGLIYGDNGYLEIENINNPEKITLCNKDGEKVREYDIPKQISGFEYQVEECIKAIENNELEVKQMPHCEILRIMKIMDEIRDKWGLVFPCE